MQLTIECQKRAPGSKPNALRQSGRIPAVLYGHSGTESISLTVNAKDAEFLVRDASLNNTLIQVNIPDLPWSGKALLREVQAHPWKRFLYHLSFFSVASHGAIEVDVPLNFVGEATGVKNESGALDTVFTSLHVQCAPDSIPETIDVDITQLAVGDAIHVKELNLPAGVRATADPDQVVVSVLATRADAGQAN